MPVTNRNRIVPLILYTIMMIMIGGHPSLSARLRLIFFLYAFFVFWVVWYRAPEAQFGNRLTARHPRFYKYLMFGAMVFFVISRVIMFVRYGEAPLGYDTGFYLQSFDALIGEIGMDRAARVLLWVPFYWMGLPRVLILHGLYVLFQFLILGGVYMLIHTLSPSGRLAYASAAVFLFAVSVPQFLAFWWIFYQMELALALLLISLALFHRRSLLVVLPLAFGFMIHPATFLPFIVAGVVFILTQIVSAVFQGKLPGRELLFMLGIGLAGFVGVRLFGRDFLDTYLHYSVGQYGWFYTNFPPQQQLQFTGLYIDRSLFLLANIYILPFSVLGILMLLMRRVLYQNQAAGRRLMFFLWMVLVLAVITHYPFVYQHRFLIVFDIVLIIFAVYPLVVLWQHFLSDKLGKAMVGILIFGFTLFGGYAVINQRPQLYPDELEEIKTLSTVVPVSDYVMTTESIYAPWVLAFSRRSVIDPGFLPLNRWNYAMWKEFWEGKDNARRHELLQMYDRPIYIFVGKIVPEDSPYRRFIASDPQFIRISQYVWWYDPNAARAESILKNSLPGGEVVIPVEATL